MNENLDEALKIRVTAVEKNRIKAEADIAGVSMSELVRRRFFGRPLVAHADMVMVKELRRLGGLLKHLYNEKMLESAEIRPVLKEMEAAMRRLATDDSQKN